MFSIAIFLVDLVYYVHDFDMAEYFKNMQYTSLHHYTLGEQTEMTSFGVTYRASVSDGFMSWTQANVVGLSSFLSTSFEFIEPKTSQNCASAPADWKFPFVKCERRHLDSWLSWNSHQREHNQKEIVWLELDFRISYARQGQPWALSHLLMLVGLVGIANVYSGSKGLGCLLLFFFFHWQSICLFLAEI